VPGWVTVFGGYRKLSQYVTSHPRQLSLLVPNVTAHPSTASVPITVLLYNGPLLCGLMCPLTVETDHTKAHVRNKKWKDVYKKNTQIQNIDQLVNSA